MHDGTAKVRRDAPKNAKQNAKLFPDASTLDAVVRAWPHLSDPIKAAILAMIEAAREPHDDTEPKRKE